MSSLFVCFLHRFSAVLTHQQRRPRQRSSFAWPKESQWQQRRQWLLGTLVVKKTSSPLPTSAEGPSLTCCTPARYAGDWCQEFMIHCVLVHPAAQWSNVQFSWNEKFDQICHSLRSCLRTQWKSTGLIVWLTKDTNYVIFSRCMNATVFQTKYKYGYLHLGTWWYWYEYLIIKQYFYHNNDNYHKSANLFPSCLSVVSASCLPPRGQQRGPDESSALRQRMCYWIPGTAGACAGGKTSLPTH